MSDKSKNKAEASVWVIAALAILFVATSSIVKPENIVELLGVHETESKLAGSRLFLWLLLADGILLGMIVIARNWWVRLETVEYLQPLVPGNGANVRGKKNEAGILIFAIILLVVATMMRIPMLDSSLWVDEVLTLVNYVQFPFSEILFSFKDDNQHLLFSLLARISVVVFGEQAWAFRLPALLFGVTSIWLCFLLARHVFDEKIALMSMVLLAISFHHVWYSQNARGYTMLLSGTLLSTLFLVRSLQGGKWRDWVGFSLSLAFCSFAHLTGVIVGAGQALVLVFVLIVYRADISYWYRAFASFFIAALLTVHGYVLVIPQIYDFFTFQDPVAIEGDSMWKSPVWMIKQFFEQFGINVGLGWFLVVVCAIVSIYTLCRMRRLTLVFALLSFIPALFLVFVMLILNRNLWPRLFFGFGGFFVIYLSVGVVIVGRYIRRRWPASPRLIAVLPAIIVCVFLLDKLMFVYEYPKQDFVGARDYIEGVKGGDDVVVGLHMAGKVYQLYYETSWMRADSVDELASFESKNGGVWVVYTLPSYIKNSKPELYERLESEYKMIKKFPGTLGDGSITVKYYKPREL